MATAAAIEARWIGRAAGLLVRFVEPALSIPLLPPPLPRESNIGGANSSDRDAAGPKASLASEMLVLGELSWTTVSKHRPSTAAFCFPCRAT